MAKPALPKITEPDEGKVHFAAPPTLDQVTLCGLTDFIGKTVGQSTRKPVNCRMCWKIIQFAHDHAKPDGVR